MIRIIDSIKRTMVVQLLIRPWDNAKKCAMSGALLRAISPLSGAMCCGWKMMNINAKTSIVIKVS